MWVGRVVICVGGCVTSKGVSISGVSAVVSRVVAVSVVTV